jgi:CRISPR-associated protein Cas5d
MTRSDLIYQVRVRGQLACFTRPELHTERVTYHVITPAAARGAVEAVLWKPAIRWRVHRIAVLAPIKFASVKRNEVKNVISVRNARAMMRGEDVPDYYADDDRAQRNSLVLRDVDYHVDVSFVMTRRAGPGDNPLKFDEMFRRRLERGQYHMSPYLGCREFPAIVEPARDDDPSPIAVDMDLGRMLLDVDFGRPNRPVYFNAWMKRGVIEVDSISRREDGEEVA